MYVGMAPYTIPFFHNSNFEIFFVNLILTADSITFILCLKLHYICAAVAQHGRANLEDYVPL